MQICRMKWWLVLVAVTVLAGCPADGGHLDLCNNPDLNCDDADACTVDSCDPTIGCVNDTVECDDGNECTTDSCAAASGCVNAPVDCDDSNACTADSCDAVFGCVNTDVSKECNDGDACTADSCNTVSGCVNEPVECDDGNECTTESCDRVSGCASRPAADGTSCDRGRGQCVGGVCEPNDCFKDEDCDDDDACTMDQCNLTTNKCLNSDISESCDDGNACTADSCEPATGCVNTDNSENCNDDNDCTTDRCDPATGCTGDPLADGTPCNGGTGECSGGTCVSLSVVEYTQNFESLVPTDTSALADDDWFVFGNVYNGTTLAFLYGYGPFVAPNDGAAFSALVTGQGGLEQGSNQLSIYSDYNNSDHANGNVVESIVFRERTLTAADVGRTIRFSFDAKRGNINDSGDPLCPCSSTATAFIKTLDPSAGFATTNLVEENTTALPDTWTRYSISLRIDAGLVGQLLQVGFSTRATLYQPSGNFYDNVEVLNTAMTSRGAAVPCLDDCNRGRRSFEMSTASCDAGCRGTTSSLHPSGIRVRGLLAMKDTCIAKALTAGVNATPSQAHRGVSYHTLKRHYGEWRLEAADQLQKLNSQRVG